MRVPEITDRTRDLLDGAVDLHIHAAPSPFPRRLGIREACEQAAWAGFAAVGFKSHHHSMTTDVAAVTESDPLPLPALTGVTITNYTGGINPYAVELSLVMGGRIVWMPTTASPAHICCAAEIAFPASPIPMRADQPIQLLDDSGAVHEEVIECLALVREHDAILCLGHTGADETDKLIDQATSMGLSRILVLHPNYVVGASPARCRSWADRGAVIEHSACMYDPRSNLHSYEIDTLCDYLSVVGLEHSMLGSDLGQANNPFPVEGFAAVAEALVGAGMGEQDIRKLVSGSASRLIEGMI